MVLPPRASSNSSSAHALDRVAEIPLSQELVLAVELDGCSSPLCDGNQRGEVHIDGQIRFARCEQWIRTKVMGAVRPQSPRVRRGSNSSSVPP